MPCVSSCCSRLRRLTVRAALAWPVIRCVLIHCLFTGSSGVAIWFGIFYIIFYLFDTIGNVPYVRVRAAGWVAAHASRGCVGVLPTQSALGPELSDVASERDSLFFWAKLFNGIGILVGAVGPVGLAVALRGSTAECTCEQTCPFGADGAAAEGVNWNATAWGNCPTAYYNASSCSESSIETLPSQLHTWCTCYNDCDAECDVAVSRTSFQTIAIVFGVYYVSSMLLCVWKVKERKFGQLSNEEAAPLVPSLLATLRNKPFMGLLPAWVCDMTAYTMIGTMLPFFVEYVIVPSSVPECADGKRAAFGMDPVAEDQESEQWCKSETWLGMGLVALIGAQIVAMPVRGVGGMCVAVAACLRTGSHLVALLPLQVWLKLTKIFGKFKTWLAFNLTTAVTNGLFVIIGQGDPKLTIMLAVLNGMPSGAQFLTDSIVADVIDYDEFLTGERAEGRFTIFQVSAGLLKALARRRPEAERAVVGHLCADIHPQDRVSASASSAVGAAFLLRLRGARKRCHAGPACTSEDVHPGACHREPCMVVPPLATSANNTLCFRSSSSSSSPAPSR